MTATPEPNVPRERDWDAEFAEITGHLEGLAADTGRRRTASANRDTVTSTAGQPASRDDTEARDGVRQGTSDAESDPPRPRVPGFRDQWRAPDATVDALTSHATDQSTDDEPSPEDDFVPPAPQPLDSDDPSTAIMLGCLVAGPLWLLYLAVFDRDTSMLWWLLAALTLATGFVLAVMRQPHRRDDEDDDGARV